MAPPSTPGGSSDRPAGSDFNSGHPRGQIYEKRPAGSRGAVHRPQTSKQPAQQRTQRRAHRPAAEHSHAPRSPPAPHPTVRCSNTTSLAVTTVGIFRPMGVISWLLIAICSMKTSQYGQPSSNHFGASTGFPVRKLGFTFGSGGLSANLLSCTYSCGLGAM